MSKNLIRYLKKAKLNPGVKKVVEGGTQSTTYPTLKSLFDDMLKD